MSTQRINFGAQPAWMRDVIKEFVILASRPDLHGDISPQIMGLKRKDLKTIRRWIFALVTDLLWLHQRSGSLRSVSHDDFDLWRTSSGLDVDHRRIGGVKAFAKYGPAMSENLDILAVEPWPGVSALKVGGRRNGKRQRANTTLPLSMKELAPLLLSAMFHIENSDAIGEALAAELQTGVTATASLTATDGSVHRWAPSDSWAAHARVTACAAMFVTAAFTGMRSSELDAIPRDGTLDDIAVGRTRRWLINSYLVKGLRQPRPEKWLVPPIVALAVETTQMLHRRLSLTDDRPFSPTGQQPLFDRRLAVVERGDGSMKVGMRLERVILAIEKSTDTLALAGLVPAREIRDAVVNGRSLRRTFVRIVAARPQGPQAAMEQFKWQHPETAGGYFRVDPDAVSIAQRDVYTEINDVHTDLVVDAMAGEYEIWKRAIEAGTTPQTPAGPDGRRKRDLFAAVRDAIQEAPRIEEDDRRVRALLREQASGITLTEYGWCDYDEAFALCGRGEGEPVPHRCEPSKCFNHSTPSSHLAAHSVNRDRLLKIGNDRQFPTLARQQAAVRAAEISKDLGHLIGG